MIYGTYHPGFPQFRNTYHPIRNSGNFKYNMNPKVNSASHHIKQNKEDFSESNSCKDSAFPKPVFEAFGIKFFFDDLLLISLLLFLYNEGVKDQYLFFALILLLLS